MGLEISAVMDENLIIRAEVSESPYLITSLLSIATSWRSITVHRMRIFVHLIQVRSLRSLAVTSFSPNSTLFRAIYWSSKLNSWQTCSSQSPGADILTNGYPPCRHHRRSLLHRRHLGCRRKAWMMDGRCTRVRGFVMNARTARPRPRTL